MESKMRIAVCDDEQAIADLVGQLLVEAGFAPTVFYAAPDLLACQADDPFDLVILDIMMPGMDGFACCRELRRTSSVPIIFLTAKDEEVGKVVGFELGADDYVVKPFKPRELVARVRARCAALPRTTLQGRMGRVCSNAAASLSTRAPTRPRCTARR